MQRQRRNINTVVCVVFIVLAVAVVAISLIRNDTTSSNSTISDSSLSGSVIQQFNNDTSISKHNSSIEYPWTLSGDKKANDTNKEESHDGSVSKFISITDMARDITPIKSTRSNKCTDSSKSLLRFTLITDNYPVSFVNFVFCAYDMFINMCSYKELGMFNSLRL